MKEWKNIVGQEQLKIFLEKLLVNKQVYKGGRVPLPHLLLELEKGDGQTHILREVSKLFKENQLRLFNSMDRYIEFDLSDTSHGNSLSQLKKMFADINNAAEYSSDFGGVIGIDVTELGNHLSAIERYKDIFINNILKVMKEATVILYISPSFKNKEKLKQYLLERLPLTEIVTQPYTSKELTEIVLLTLEDMGISLEKPDRLIPILVPMIDKRSIKTVTEAVFFVEQELVYLADYSKKIPVLKANRLQREEKNYEKCQMVK